MLMNLMYIEYTEYTEPSGEITEVPNCPWNLSELAQEWTVRLQCRLLLLHLTVWHARTDHNGSQRITTVHGYSMVFHGIRGIQEEHFWPLAR